MVGDELVVGLPAKLFSQNTDEGALADANVAGNRYMLAARWSGMLHWVCLLRADHEQSTFLSALCAWTLLCPTASNFTVRVAWRGKPLQEFGSCQNEGCEGAGNLRVP